MTSDTVETFIKIIKENSTYSKCIERNIIEKIISIFDVPCEKMQYPCAFNNCMQIVLQFYMQYNYSYYKIIINGLKKKKIIIDDTILKSYTDPIKKKTYIKLNENDGDIFMLVHEFAHFIDRSLTTNIIPDKYNFLCEVFSFYMERQLEKHLLKKYQNCEKLIVARKNNRLFYEKKFINDIKKQLYYEDLFNNQGTIIEEQIDVEDAKKIIKYNVANVIDYLLRYPLGISLSEYIIDNNLLKQDCDICKICLMLDFDTVLDDFFSTKTKVKKFID